MNMLKTTGGRSSVEGIANTARFEGLAQLSQSFMLCTARSASNLTTASFFFRRVASIYFAEILSRSMFTLLCTLKKAYEYEVAGRVQ